MKALKLGFIISLAVLFLYGCGSPGTTDSAPSSDTSSSKSDKVQPTPAPTSTPQPEATPLTGGNADIGKKPVGAPDEKKDDGKMAAKPASNIDAAALFTAQKCVGCHQADGKGNPKIKDVPDFTSAEWQKKESDAELIEGIKKGKKPMPAYQGKLSEDEIIALVSYVRSFAKK